MKPPEFENATQGAASSGRDRSTTTAYLLAAIALVCLVAAVVERSGALFVMSLIFGFIWMVVSGSEVQSRQRAALARHSLDRDRDMLGVTEKGTLLFLSVRTMLFASVHRTELDVKLHGQVERIDWTWAEMRPGGYVGGPDLGMAIAAAALATTKFSFHIDVETDQGKFEFAIEPRSRRHAESLDERLRTVALHLGGPKAVPERL